MRHILKTMNGNTSLTMNKNRSNSALCTVCTRPKNQLRPRKSKIIPDTTLLLCGECFEGKREPRWAIIMACMRYGYEAVEDYIVNHRYVGEEITVKETRNKQDIG